MQEEVVRAGPRHDDTMAVHPPLPSLVIAGAGGVIGRALLRAAAGRYRPVVLTRGGTSLADAETIVWNPNAASEGDESTLLTLAEAMRGAAAVVNLAGSSIARGRLGPKHRALVRESRVRSGATLVAALERCAEPPRAYFQASGTNIYREGGDEPLDESAPIVAEDTLGEIGLVWEASAEPARAFSRVTVGRIGVVLAPDAEAWQRLLLPIRLGVGGPLGNGRQWWPWIHVDDVARAILWCIEEERAEGAYNLVAEPTRQIDLVRAAARRLRRPALLPVPAFALRLLLGTAVADALLLESRRVVPERLQEAGFSFLAPTIEEGVERLLTQRRGSDGAS
jgi:uncharacterized protein